MDFDKKLGTAASAPMVRRGRGFTEKPVVQPILMKQQNRTRSTQKKVTPDTELYFGMSAALS